MKIIASGLTQRLIIVLPHRLTVSQPMTAHRSVCQAVALDFNGYLTAIHWFDLSRCAGYRRTALSVQAHNAADCFSRKQWIPYCKNVL